jgi:hypothetical protein
MITRLLLAVSCTVAAGGAGDEWKTFTPKAGGFTVSFPGTPTEHKQSVKMPSGSSIEVMLYVYEPKKGEGQYVVSFSEYPDSALKAGTDEKRLENARDGAIQNVKGKLKGGTKHIKVDGYPGLDLTIETKENILVRTRIYAVKNRLYQTLVIGPPKMVTAKETEQFLNSFKLVK